MTSVLGQAEIEQFRTVLTRHLGLQYEDGKLEYLSDVLLQRMQSLGRARFDSYSAYLCHLNASPQGSAEWRALAEQLTVNETFFFRNSDNFLALAEIVLPDRIREALVRNETEGIARIQMDLEREKLDQRLRDHQFYTRSLFESNIDALMTTDPAGIITDVNNQMEALTECTRDELIGAPLSRYFTDPERAEESIKLVLIKKKLTNYELTVRARGGKETVVSFNTTTFYDRDRNLQGVFSAARDITERKLFDQVLLQKNLELEKAKSAAEKANLAKSDFLSSMSHELRTPLNAILGFTQLIESGTPLPTPAQQQNLEEVLKAGWYLLDLINEILDLAQMESGKDTLLMAPRLSPPLRAVFDAEQVPLVRSEEKGGMPVHTLLYVEDNPANLELVEQLIARRPDLRLLKAADGNIGIEFARIYQPDVILMDINLPGISGLDAMKILRADSSTAHIPIIAISVNALPQDVEKAIQAGFFKYLTKPFKVIEFMEAVDVAFKLTRKIDVE